jgi:hypothetical protein
MRRDATLGGLLATLALAVAGCGGSAARPTPNFATIANTICTNADTEIAALPAGGSSLGALAAQAQRELPIVRTEVRQLSALVAPRSEQADFSTALSAAHQQLPLIARLISAVRAQRTASVATIALRARALDQRDKATMAALGLNACASQALPRGRG